MSDRDHPLHTARRQARGLGVDVDLVGAFGQAAQQAAGVIIFMYLQAALG